MSRPSWARDLLDFLLPAGCVVCAAWVPAATSVVCATCRSRLRSAPWPRCPRCHHPTGTGRHADARCIECAEWPEALTSARFAYVLEGPSADLVHALKYEGWKELARSMGDAMSAVVGGFDPPVGDATPVVAHVPTTRARVARRGYDQADLLAERVAAVTGLARAHALERTGARDSQTALSPARRRVNVRGVFRVVPAARSGIEGRHVVLVDDVLTTGATAGEAARALADSGAASVTLLCFARALPRLERRAA